MCTVVFFLIWFLVTDEYIESCCTENYSLKIFNGSSCTRYSIHLLFLINDKVWELQLSSHLIILSINARFQSEGHKEQIKLLTQRLCVLQSLYQPKSLSQFKLMLYIVKQIYSGGIFLSSGEFFLFSFPTKKATVAAINNLVSHHFFMDWIQSEFFCYCSQEDCDSPSKIMSGLVLVSWQASYRKRSGLLISVIHAAATSIVDCLSNSLNLQELGKLPPNTLHTAQRLAFHKAPFQLLKFVISVETQPRGFKFTFLWPLYLISYELWIQMQNLNDDHIFACKLWSLLILPFNFCLSCISQQQLLNVYASYVAMVPFTVLSKTLWN